MSLRAACCYPKSSIAPSPRPVPPRCGTSILQCILLRFSHDLTVCRTQARQAPQQPVLRFCDASAFSVVPICHSVSARSSLHKAFGAQALEVTHRAFCTDHAKVIIEFTVVNIEPILKGRRIVRATSSLQACLFSVHERFWKSTAEAEGVTGLCPTRWKPVVRVAGASRYRTKRQVSQRPRVVLVWYCTRVVLES